MNKRSLSILFLIGILVTVSWSALVRAHNTMDSELQEVLKNADPSDVVGIIIVFQEKPTDEEINALETIHGMEITHVYEIIKGVAGKAPAQEIVKIAEYNFVKEIWLDKKVYATEEGTVETSKLMEALQTENDELRQKITTLEQEIGSLQDKVQKQQIDVSQLELNLKIYSVASFIAGLIVGMATIILVGRASEGILHTKE